MLQETHTPVNPSCLQLSSSLKEQVTNCLEPPSKPTECVKAPLSKTKGTLGLIYEPYTQQKTAHGYFHARLSVYQSGHEHTIRSDLMSGLMSSWTQVRVNADSQQNYKKM